jgi:hypothetical protein
MIPTAVPRAKPVTATFERTRAAARRPRARGWLPMSVSQSEVSR